MKHIFYPTSIAVIGVSTAEDNLARNIVENLLNYKFRGTIHPVGRSGGEVFGLQILPDVASIPAAIDFAAIFTPAATVPGFMTQCVARGVKGFWIGSGGFSEFDGQGAALEAQLCAIAREAGVRFVGPNCWGIINMENGLCIPFGRMRPIPAGHTSILAQSGGVGISLMQELTEERIGINKFVSMGNKANVDEIDLLAFLGEDAGTRVICLYLEGMSRGREFIETAGALDKPVLLLKSNTTPLARVIAQTHTASIAGDDAVLDAAVASAGVIRVHTVREMVETANIFRLPPMRGRRVAVLSRSGGHAVIAADECARAGFTLPALPQDILDRVKSRLRAGVVQLGNPLDLGDLYDNDFYAEMLDRVLAVDEIDGVVLLFTYGAMLAYSVPEVMIGQVRDLVARHHKPVAFCLLSWLDETSRVKKVVDYPVYSNTEEAIRALDRAQRYWAQKQSARRIPARIPAMEIASASATIIAACRERGETLVSYEALAALKAAGVETVPTYLAHDLQEVRTYASGMAFPIVLKAVAPGIAHKSDVGGVVLGITGALDAAARAIEMRERVELTVPGSKVEAFMLQETAPAGVEMFIGAGRDPSFGPFVTVGLGGVLVELFRDVAMRPAPLDAVAATDLLKSLKAWRLLTGFRGRPPCDVKALAEAIVKVGNLIAAESSLREIDINPIVVYPEGLGALAVDARMVLG